MSVASDMMAEAVLSLIVLEEKLRERPRAQRTIEASSTAWNLSASLREEGPSRSQSTA